MELEDYIENEGLSKALFSVYPKLIGVDFSSVIYNKDDEKKNPVHYLTSDIDGSWYFGLGSMPMIFKAVSKTHIRCDGAYAVLALITGHGLLAFRDNNGIRPLSIGIRKGENRDEYVIASEDALFISLGFTKLRDVDPGEAVFIDKNGKLFSQQCADNPIKRPCIFEYVYFARPDSVIDGISVYEARLNQGKILAERILSEWPDHDIDAVIPIPDSGRIAALQMASSLKVPYREGFVKNRYIGRTFIMPGQSLREKSVRRKLNAIDDEFRGKNVLLVDDSIVRGTTSKQIVEMARESGASKVYFASAAPPVRFPNVYGIDMPATSEFIANNRTIDQINEHIGSDKLFYQTLEDLIKSTKISSSSEIKFDSSCFDGVYVTGDVTEEYLELLHQQRNDNAKQENLDDDQILDIHNDSN